MFQLSEAQIEAVRQLEQACSRVDGTWNALFLSSEFSTSPFLRSI